MNERDNFASWRDEQLAFAATLFSDIEVDQHLQEMIRDAKERFDIRITKAAILADLRKLRRQLRADEARSQVAGSEWFVLQHGNKVRVARWRTSQLNGHRHDVLDMLTKADFELLMSNDPGPEGSGFARTFLESMDRPTFDGVWFSADPRNVPPGKLNLWRGWGVEHNSKPQTDADVRPYLDHVEAVIADGDLKVARYLLDWCAWAVQNPEHVVGVIVGLLGEQGTGKGVFAQVMRTIFGQHGVHLTGTGKLTGRFNDYLSGACFVYADEAIFAGDREGATRLKTLATEAELMIERKFVDAVPMPNRMKIIMATNDAHVANIERGDRRYFITRVSSQRKGDHDYFVRLTRWLYEEGGVERIMKWLLDRDVSRWDQIKDRPESAEYATQKVRSLIGVPAWWHDTVELGMLRGAPPGGNEDWDTGQIARTRADLNADYIDWCRARFGERFSHLPASIFFKELREVAEVVSESRPRGLFPEDPGRPRVMVLEKRSVQMLKLDLKLG